MLLYARLTSEMEKRKKSNTSRPSQNSASVIWPVITRSRCSAPKSGLPTRTFFRSRKSLDASIPGMTGVERRSLDIDAALDVEGRD